MLQMYYAHYICTPCSRCPTDATCCQRYSPASALPPTPPSGASVYVCVPLIVHVQVCVCMCRWACACAGVHVQGVPVS